MKTILTLLGILAWISVFVSIYNNNIDYAILFAIFVIIFNTEKENNE